MCSRRGARVGGRSVQTAFSRFFGGDFSLLEFGSCLGFCFRCDSFLLGSVGLACLLALFVRLQSCKPSVRLCLSLSLFACQFLTLLLCFQFAQGLGTLIFKVSEFERELQILVGILLTLRFQTFKACVNGISHAPFLMVVHIGSILRCKIQIAQRRYAVTDSSDNTLGFLPALTLLSLFLGFGAVALRVHPVLNGLDLSVSTCGSVHALLLFGRNSRRFVFGVG